MSCCFSYFLSLSQSCKMFLSIFLCGSVTISLSLSLSLSSKALEYCLVILYCTFFLFLSLEEKSCNNISIFFPFSMSIDLCAPLPMFVSCTKSEEEEIWRNERTKEPTNQKVNLIRPSLREKNKNHEGTKELKKWIGR